MKKSFLSCFVCLHYCEGSLTEKIAVEVDLFGVGVTSDVKELTSLKIIQKFVLVFHTWCIPSKVCKS